MYYIGIDFGGTNIAAGIVDENFNIVHKDSTPTNAGRPWEEIIDDMVMISNRMMEHEGIDISEIKYIGIGIPGKIDRDSGVIIYSNNLNFNNVPIVERIQKQLDLPVYIENDANAAALGEAYSGATKDASDSIMITLGTGIGGGIIIGKKIYAGYNGSAAELGHTVIVVDGEMCSCGRPGCWEAYASATALIRQTKDAAKNNPDSILAQLARDGVNGKTVFDAKEKGCPVAQQVFDNYIKYLGAGITDMINIFRPEILVIGGGISKQGDNLLIPLKKYIAENVYGGTVDTEIRIAQLGNDAGIVGAAALGI